MASVWRQRHYKSFLLAAQKGKLNMQNMTDRLWDQIVFTDCIVDVHSKLQRIKVVHWETNVITTNK